MADETIKIPIEVIGADKAAADIQKVDNSLQEASKTAEKASKNIGSSVAGTQKSVQAFSKSFGGAVNAVELLGLKSDAMSKTIGQVSKATQVWTIVQKALNLVLKANPIGLIVTVLAALITGIIALWEPIKKLGEKFKWIGAIVNGIIGIFNKLRDAIAPFSMGLINDTATANTIDNANKIIAAMDNVDNQINKNINTMKNRIRVMEAEGASEKEIIDEKVSLISLEIAKRKEQIAAYDSLVKAGEKLTDEQIQQYEKLKQEIVNFEVDSSVILKSYEKKKSDESKAAWEKEKAEKKRIAKEKESLQANADKELLTIENANRLQSIQDEKLRSLEAIKIYEEESAKKIEEMRKAGVSAKTIAKMETAIHEKTARDKKIIDDKYQKEKEDSEKAYHEKKLALEQEYAILTAETEQTKGELQLQYQHEAAMAQIDQMKIDQQEKNDLKLLEEQRYQEALQQMQADYAQKEIDKGKADAKKKLDDQLAAMNAIADAAAGLGQSMMEISDLVYSVQLKNVTKGSAEERKIKKQQFETNKKMQIAMALIMGIQSAINAYQSGVAVPIVGTVLGPVYMALSILTTGIQIAKIASSKFDPGPDPAVSTTPGSSDTPKPKPARFGVGGVLFGPSHAAGGIKTSYGELEGGEAVINKTSTMMYGGMLSAINTIGGGKSFATGGTVGREMADFQRKISSTPMKTYVVASEMSSEQEANFRLNNLSRL